MDIINDVCGYDMAVCLYLGGVDDINLLKENCHDVVIL